MSIKLFDAPVTANEYAKWLLYDKMEAAYYFRDYDHEHMTERECEEVGRFLEKNHDRVRKMLGIGKIVAKTDEKFR